MLLSLARSRLGSWLTGWAFAHLSFALPVRRVCETDTLLAFWHPRPLYPVHILLVPKKAITTLDALTPADDVFLLDALRTAHKIAAELGLAERGCRLLVNGGAYQEVPQLHFHLIAAVGDCGLQLKVEG
jgi:histidine triad (HIT) family protein